MRLTLELNPCTRMYTRLLDGTVSVASKVPDTRMYFLLACSCFIKVLIMLMDDWRFNQLSWFISFSNVLLVDRGCFAVGRGSRVNHLLASTELKANTRRPRF